MTTGVATELAAFEAGLRRNAAIAALLDRFDAIGLPDAWLVAGGVAQTMWNLAAGRPAEAGIKDLDIVYFDPGDLSADGEGGQERRVRGLFPGLPALDVKNEARVHLWSEARFGHPIPPYCSTADAIASFPTTATAVGVRCRAGRFELCAPFGLGDLMDGVVRPNKRQITEPIYRAKADRWRSEWPGLVILPWDGSDR